MGRPRKLESVPGVRIWKRSGEGPRAKYKITYREPGAEAPTTKAVSSDYDITLDKAKAVKARIDRVAQGLAQPKQERWLEHDQTTLSKHLDDYEQALKDANCDPKHIRQMADYARAVLLGSTAPRAKAKRNRGQRVSVPPLQLPSPGWHRVSFVTVDGVRRQIGRIKEQRSLATANRYLDAVRAFLAWGRPGRWGENPALEVQRFNAEADRRVTRRIISPEQFGQLITTTEAGPVRARLTGHERARIYLTCLLTGLRRKESRMLLVGHLRLTGARRGIALPAKLAKNRKGLFIPLPDWMADDLAEATAGKRHDEPALRVPSNTARMLRADLEAAGIPYRTHDGVFDFHAIRHESGALLVAAGANPKRVQAHMRHSRITLTMDTYGHILPDERDTTMLLLPDFGRTGAQRNAQRDSGFDSPQMSANVPDEKQGHEKTPEKTGVHQWSDGESNPDLLNAIQPTHLRISLSAQELRRYENLRAAQGAAPGRFYRFRGRVLRRVPRPTRSDGAAAMRALVGRLLSPAGPGRAKGGAR